MNVPVLTPLELRQLEIAADFCDDDCRTCALLSKLLQVIRDQAEKIIEQTNKIVELEEQLFILDDEGHLNHHTYLPWSSAYEPRPN